MPPEKVRTGSMIKIFPETRAPKQTSTLDGVKKQTQIQNGWNPNMAYPICPVSRILSDRPVSCSDLPWEAAPLTHPLRMVLLSTTSASVIAHVSYLWKISETS